MWSPWNSNRDLIQEDNGRYIDVHPKWWLIYLICKLQLVVETFGLDTKLNEPTNQNLIKVTKVVKQTNKKTLL